VEGEVQTLKEVWYLDANPPEYRYRDGRPLLFSDRKDMRPRYPNDEDWLYEGRAHGPSHFLANPVFHQGLVYVGIGRDNYHHGRPKGTWGRVMCVDPDGKGDITETGIVWENRDVGRTQCTVSIVDNVLFIADIDGTLYCLDPVTGRTLWTHDLESKVTCRSQFVADGKVYAINDRGAMYVFAAEPEKQLLAEVDLRCDGGERRKGDLAITPTAVDGILYLATPRWIAGYAPESPRDEVMTVDGARQRDLPPAPERTYED
jgi:hypothetical protein